MRPHLLALLFIASILPWTLHAQSLENLGDAAPFSMTASPQYPLPYGKATLSFLSTSLDLANANLNVRVNGKLVYAGAVHSVTVALGAAGSVANVTATISTGSAEYTQTLLIQPQDVVLVAEPLSSAPALYPGKPQVALEGSVRIVAIANLRTNKGAAYGPANLSYAWTVEGVRMANASGIGKNALITASPLQYRAREISVVVSSADGSSTGGSSVSLAAAEPSVRMYENDPLLGVRFERALAGSYSIKSAESSLYAAPFSLPTKGGAPLIEWFLNGSSAQNGNSITLRPTGSGEGEASLSVVASAGGYLKATANLLLSFGGKSTSNFFGL